MNKKEEMLSGSDIGGIIFKDESGNEKKIPFELPEFNLMPKELYSNHVIINHTSTEYNLIFGRVNPIITNSQIPKGKYAKLDVIARITLPPQIIEGLIKALEINFENYKAGK